jgi:uncharacterized protein HemY
MVPLVLTVGLLLLAAVAPQGVFAEEDKLSLGLAQAESLTGEGRYDEALDMLDGLEHDYPRNREIPLLRADIHKLIGNDAGVRRNLFDACSLGSTEACQDLQRERAERGNRGERPPRPGKGLGEPPAAFAPGRP